MPYTKVVLGNKPLYVRGPIGSEIEYTAQMVRMLASDVFDEGVVGANDLLGSIVSGLTVSHAAGSAYVAGSMVTNQGLYREQVDAAVQITVGAHHATLPRLDQIILRIMDAAHDTSGLYEARIEVIPGTATAGATLVNRNGAADLTTLDEDSKNVLLLTDVLVPATAGAITIGDKRVRASVGAGSAEGPTSGATVTETVAGGGTATSGKTLLIRAGGADTIADSWKTMIYDEVYMKWISAEREFPAGIAFNSTASYTAYLDNTSYNNGWVNSASEVWKIFDTAGLTPQMKVAGVIDISATATPTARGGYGSANLGDTCGNLYTNGITLVAAVTADVGGSSVTAGSGVAVASAWAQIPGGFTAKDLIFWGTQVKASANQGRFFATIFSRWIG